MSDLYIFEQYLMLVVFLVIHKFSFILKLFLSLVIPENVRYYTFLWRKHQMKLLRQKTHIWCVCVWNASFLTVSKRTWSYVSIENRILELCQKISHNNKKYFHYLLCNWKFRKQIRLALQLKYTGIQNANPSWNWKCYCYDSAKFHTAVNITIHGTHMGHCNLK